MELGHIEGLLGDIAGRLFVIQFVVVFMAAQLTIYLIGKK